MFRFGFNIRTRGGQRIENISIVAQSQADAERRLRQMYQLCEVLACHSNAVPRKSETLDVESVISMICAQPAIETSPVMWRSGSRDKAVAG
jgi:hypothetical protein